MAPLPQSTTTRWWLIYTVNGTTHRMMMRTSAAATPAQVSGFYSTFLTNITTSLNSVVVNGLEKALQGSNVRNPQVYSGTLTFGTGTEADTDGRPRSWSWTGKSSDGRKTKLFVFGTKQIAEGDMRIDSTESAGVASNITFLNSTIGAFLSISGLQPVWHLYANIGYNDHWIKEYRKG